MTAPRVMPSAEHAPWYEIAGTILIAGLIGGTGAWLIIRWRRWA